MLSMYLNSSTCIYLSLAIDNGVTITSKRREKSQFDMFFFPSYKFFLSFAFFSRGKLGTCLRICCSCSRKRKVQLSTWAGMRTVVPFWFSIRSLVDNLSNTWINGMLMQMLDPAALTVLVNEIQSIHELLCLLLTFHVFSEKITRKE